MLVQAAGLALLAALSPTALLVVAVYLGSASPGKTAVYYLAGAVLMTTVIAAVALVILRSAGLSRPDQHSARDGLRLGLGLLLAMAGVAVLARRWRRGPEPARQGHGIVSRLVASPTPRSAFATGVLVFAPGATFLAAVQVIATARVSIGFTVIGTAVIVIINVLLAWLPLVLYLAAPRLTEQRLKAFNGWLRAHGSALLAGTLAVAGVILIFDGCYGLITGS